MPARRPAMVPPATAMTSPAHDCLGDLFLPVVMAMDPQGKERRPCEEDNLHDPHGKARLEHRARLVQTRGFKISVEAEPEGAQRHLDAPAVPMGTVRIGDEAQLVDAGDECAKEAQIDKGDKAGGAASVAQTDEGIEAPEHGDGADDEEHQDVARSELVCPEVAIDEVGLERDDR